MSQSVLIRQELLESYRGYGLTVSRGLLDGRQVAIIEDEYNSIEEANVAIRQSLSVARLKHPNVCEIYDCFLEEANSRIKSVIYMELPDSDLYTQTNLRAAQQAYWSESELMHYLVQLTAALSLAQQQAISHRDIKPHSIYCSSDGRNVKIGGFYSIKKLVSDELLSQTINGTPLFFSPQKKRMHIHRLRGTRDTTGFNSFKADVYSLGVTFLYLARLSSPSDLAHFDQLHIMTRRLLSEVSTYSTLSYFLGKMLQIEEEDRCDFISLEQELQRWQRQMDQSEYKDQWRLDCSQPAGPRCVYCSEPVTSSDQVVAECGHIFHDSECFFAYVRDASRYFTVAEGARCPACGLSISMALLERVLTPEGLEARRKAATVCGVCGCAETSALLRCGHRACAAHIAAQQRCGFCLRL